MSESNLNQKFLQKQDKNEDEEIDSKELEEDYQMLFTDAAKNYHNLSTNNSKKEQINQNLQQQQQNTVDMRDPFKHSQDQEISDESNMSLNSQNCYRQQSLPSQAGQQKKLPPSILKKKSSYDQSQNKKQTRGGLERQSSLKGEDMFESGMKQFPFISTIPEESDNNSVQSQSHVRQQNQVQFDKSHQSRFSKNRDIFRSDISDNNNQNQRKFQDQMNDQPGSVDEEKPAKRSDVDYWKGELPLDIFLEGAYEKGQRTNLDALTVYRPEVDPKLYRTKKFDTYLHFDEKMYDYISSVKEGRKRNMLRKINENDGFLGFYSQNKKNDVLKLLVCVTMYSESREFLENTLYHIYKNLKGFVGVGLKDFQIVVVVIQDGIMKMREETVDFYSEMEGDNRNPKRNLKLRRFEIQKQVDFLKFKGQESILEANEGLPPTIPKRIALVYQNRLYFVKEKENDKHEKPIVYSSNNNRSFNQNQAGMTVFSVFKHRNAKKLSSHMWFFEGFCRQFNPKYCALVDVGTLPASDGLLKFYIAMESNSRIGGVCGFLGLQDPPQYHEKINQKQIEQNLALEELVQERQEELENNTIWWKLWQQRKKLSQKKIKDDQQKSEEEQELTEEKLQTQLKRQKHDKSKKINAHIFQFIFFLPFNLIYMTIYLIYFIIYKCFFKFTFKLLKWISLGYLNILASLKKAQMYEYIMAHMLDKNFESLLGFLHVLPGAWSAYRYEALEIKYWNRQNLLQKRYFKQLVNPDQLEGNIQEANMFLAEDRILCLGIYCQPDSNYLLKYIPDAKAFTDPVDTLEELMNQRRRWINSTLFALDYVLKHYSHHVQESTHSYWNKNVLLPFNMLFAKIGELNTYFLPAFYFFVAITSSYQLLSPEVKYGYLYKASKSDNPDQSDCDMNISPTKESLCSTHKPEKYPCYIDCEDRNFPQIVFSVFNLVPAIYIVCFLFIVFASLTFKIKKINPVEVKEKLCSTLLTPEQQIDVKARKKAIEEMEKQIYDQLNMTSKQLKRGKQKLEKERKKLQKHIIKITKKQFKSMVERIGQHSIKLSPKEKEFKETYDSMISQDKQNKTFKILSAVMSFISIVVMLIVLLSIAMNVTNSNFGLVNGFVKLDDWLRLYVIIMVLVNSGSFLILLFVHFLFQPSLVWYVVISYWSYIIYQPIYNFILIIYSFCNLDDVTWGTKGISSDNSVNKFYQGKVKFLINWFAANALLLIIMLSGNIFSGKTPYIILFIGLYGTAYLAIKTILAVLNYIKYFLFDKWLAYFRIRSSKRKSNNQQQEMEVKFKDFLHAIEQSKAKSQNEWGYLYHQNSISSYSSTQNQILASKDVKGFIKS